MIDPGMPVVVVPARNEEALLPKLLRALSRQTILTRFREPLEIVVVLNNTDDGSGLAARHAVAGLPQLRLTMVDVHFPAGQAHVGSARSLAMGIGSAMIGDRAGVILTTDADAVPRDDWIDGNLRAIAAGADLVGGRIVGDPEEEDLLGPEFLRRAAMHARYAALRDQLAAAIDPLDYDPWPRHHDHTGASLAVRNNVYRDVGGLDPLPFREDLAFVAKVQAAGFRLRHAPEVSVTVSARTVGRAAGGMAECLRNWIREELSGAPILVECPRSVQARLILRRRLRVLQGRPPSLLRPCLDRLGLPETSYRSTVPGLIARFAADDPDAVGTMPAALAIAQLEQMIATSGALANAA
ncbi:glycosyltransferase [Aquibium carbonis]|uniref:Glycosyltransferase n=1 Tax=Aquibium carbonis TaxID=2495581 RepID=A0A429Z259_9HYPH|nr:glycosyltransferase [Aquibium carbonis]RST87720.1 glycosyltransferase [Aquibium carbonis]